MHDGGGQLPGSSLGGVLLNAVLACFIARRESANLSSAYSANILYRRSFDFAFRASLRMTSCLYLMTSCLCLMTPYLCI